jgi:hypothetical protein
MRETEEIENYLNGNLRPEDRLLMEAKLLVNPELQEKSRWQQITYKLVQKFGRKQLKQEIKETEHRLFTAPEFAGFQQKIQAIFN